MKRKKAADDSATYDHIKLTEEQVKELVQDIIGANMEDSVATKLMLLLYATANAARSGNGLDVESILFPAEEAALTCSISLWKALHRNVNATFEALQSERRAR